MNTTPPYEIGPEDVTKDMLLRNVAPGYDQLTCLIAEGLAIPVHDPDLFDQSQVSQKRDLDSAALATMGKLNAPLLVYHREIIDIFDRLWTRTMKDKREEFTSGLLHDRPELDLNDHALVARIARTVTSNALMGPAMGSASRYSAYFVSERLKHGLDPGVHSAVAAVPDLKANGDPTHSLISIHGVENNLGDERLYVDLYRP